MLVRGNHSHNVGGPMAHALQIKILLNFSSSLPASFAQALLPLPIHHPTMQEAGKLSACVTHALEDNIDREFRVAGIQQNILGSFPPVGQATVAHHTLVVLPGEHEPVDLQSESGAVVHLSNHVLEFVRVMQYRWVEA